MSSQLESFSLLILKEIPIAMAASRNLHGICPPEILKFLLDLFKYNDNSKNSFSDIYYRSALVIIPLPIAFVFLRLTLQCLTMQSIEYTLATIKIWKVQFLRNCVFYFIENCIFEI